MSLLLLLQPNVIASASTLIDPFNQTSLDTTKWLQYTAGSATVSYSSTGAVIQYPTSTTNLMDGEISSLKNYSLTSSAVFMEVTAVPFGGGTVVTDAQLRLGDATNNLTLIWEGGTLYAQKWVAGTKTTIATVTHSLTTHRWWRIREASGTTYWETSPDAVTWNVLTSQSNPIPVTSLNVLIAGTAYSSATSPGTFTFRNVNYIPIVLTKTQSSTARLAQNYTKTQPIIANIAKNITKIQTSIGRVAVNKTTTHPSIARISQNFTKTQSNVAKIANNRTKTQNSIARVSQGLTRTQGAISRVSSIRTKTQPAVTRISNTFTKIQINTSHISNNTSKTQTSIANIIQTSLDNRYWVGGTGIWDDTATTNWSYTSGGVGGAPAPISSNSVYFDSNSFTTSGQTVTLNSDVNILNMDWTGVTNNPTFDTNTYSMNIYGDTLKFVSGMSLPTYSTDTTDSIYIYATDNISGTFNITTGGQYMPFVEVTSRDNGVTFSIEDNYNSNDVLVISTYTGSVDVGTKFLTNNYNITNAGFYLGSIDTAILGTSVITSSGDVDLDYDGSNLNNLSATGATVIMNTNLDGGYYYSNSSQILGTLIVNSIYNPKINTDTTINSISITAGSSLTFSDYGTLYVTNFDAVGSASSPITIRAYNDGFPYVISKSSGVVNASYIDIKDSTVTGGATWNALNSIDSGDNIGWNFLQQLTQSAVAYITTSNSKIQTAVAHISSIRTKTQSATAKISKISTKIQVSIARITNTKTYAQTAIAKIAKINVLTRSVKASISQTLTKVQTVRSYIVITRTKTQQSIAKIVINRTKIQGATAYIGVVYGGSIENGGDNKYDQSDTGTGTIVAVGQQSGDNYNIETIPTGDYGVTSIDESNNYGVE